MDRAGLRELRQQASELVRRAESGDRIVVTVSGRDVAQLGPIESHRWRRFDDICALFDGPPDRDWDSDRLQIDQQALDPFAR